MDYTVGIDFGGTKMLGALVAADGSIEVDHLLPTPYNGEELLDGLAELTLILEDKAGVTASGVGIGAAGLVDRAGILHYGPNVGRVTEVDVLNGVRSRLPGREIRVDNDNTCATWAEFVLGAGKGSSEMVFVGLGTGIGCGIVSGGHLFRGKNGFAAEAGHMTVQANGIDCVCGKVGCWEAYASGRSVGRMGREIAAEGRAHALLEYAGAVDDIRGEHVTALAREGDAACIEVMDRLSWWLAVGVANLIAVLDPELVVIGGGMSGESDLFFDGAKRYLHEMVLGADNRPLVPLEAAAMGPFAGALGAAMLFNDDGWTSGQ